MYSYSQHGSIYSGVYSCSLGYVREFLFFVSALISVKFNYFEGGCYCFLGLVLKI